MSILTATIAQVNLRAFSVEGLMDENGDFYVAVPQMVDIGLIPASRSAKQLEALTGVPFTSLLINVKTEMNPKPINALPIEYFEDVLVSLSISGNKAATEMIRVKHGITASTETKRKGINYAEKLVRDSLHSKLGGEIEVRCLAGKIDLLTSTEIIEVKQITGWKEAIGQILVYGDYYPSHSKRIHLFGETQLSFLDMIKNHCAKQNIKVTWQKK